MDDYLTSDAKADPRQTGHSDLLAERRRLFDTLLELQAAKSRVDAELRDVTGRYRDLEARFQSTKHELDRTRREHGALLSGSNVTNGPLLKRFAAKCRSWLSVTPRQRYRLAADCALLTHSVLLDSAWYLRSYPDVHSAGLSAAAHYLLHGWREGRNPGPLFDTAWYLERYSDVQKADINPLVHFIKHGAAEGRFPSATVANGRWFNKHFPIVLDYLTRSIGALGPITRYEQAHPAVSIIVLNFNKALLTLQCITSLWTHTEGHSYEVIVVDNGSSREDLEILNTIRGPFRTVLLAVNRYFGEANNIGAEAAKGDILVFMNNDIVVTPGWLDPLIRTLHEYPDAGAVGPTFLYPDGRLQEAGALVREDGRTIQRGKNSDFDPALYANTEPVDYVSAATVAMKASSFQKALGFDFCWEPAYYEDVDLCFKLRALGLMTYYCPKSQVYHFENATSTDQALDLQLGDVVEVNRAKFVTRWGAGRLADAGGPVGQEDPAAWSRLERNTSSTRPSVGLFSPYNMIPGGGEKYLLSIVQATQPGYDPYLVTPEIYSRIRIATIARALELSLDGLRLTTLKELDSDGKFDVWIAMGNAIVPPSPPRGKTNIFILQFPFPTDQATIDRARPCLDGYDVVVVYSKFAHKRVTELYKTLGVLDKTIEIVSPPVSIAGRHRSVDKRRGSIISVGRFFSGWHCKNQHLMIAAFRSLTEILGQEPLELHLAGSLHPERENREYFTKCHALAEGLPVYFHLDATPAELRDLYSSASVYWHATGLDADLVNNPEKAEHFGITVVEAMASGCIPIVFSQGGPAEIVEDGVSGLTYGSMQEMLSSTSAVICEWDAERVETTRNAAISRATMFDVPYFNHSWSSLIERTATCPQAVVT